MPLRDHFHSPLIDETGWDALHGGWPMVIVQQLNSTLPQNYVAEPRVHPAQLEVDIGTFEKLTPPNASTEADGGGVATAVWVAQPALRVETEPPNFDEYEVRIFRTRPGRQLVAAIEIVSPSNKDRPTSRATFVSKCADLLRRGVAVSIVDLVTERQFNLYTELMQVLGHPDPSMAAGPPAIYAASCRWLLREPRSLLESWSEPLAVGRPLPQLPLWLSENLVVPLDLERSYEQTCRDLRIG